MARADAERNRRRIVETALRVFASQPVARLEEIASAAGVTRTTLYRHFPSREALVTATYAAALATVLDAVTRAELDRGPTESAFERAVEAILAVADQHRVLVSGPSADLNDPALLDAYDTALAPIIELVRRAQRAGDVAADLPAWWIADTLFSLIITALAALGDGRLRRDELASLILRSFRTGAAPDPQEDRP